jgi:hypothetical protein
LDGGGTAIVSGLTVGASGRGRPVTFPPGRARLAASPALTGPTPLVMTIGMVVVAFMAVTVFGLNSATSEKWHPTASVIDQVRCLSWVKRAI